MTEYTNVSTPLTLYNSVLPTAQEAMQIVLQQHPEFVKGKCNYIDLANECSSITNPDQALPCTILAKLYCNEFEQRRRNENIAMAMSMAAAQVAADQEKSDEKKKRMIIVVGILFVLLLVILYKKYKN